MSKHSYNYKASSPEYWSRSRPNSLLGREHSPSTGPCPRRRPAGGGWRTLLGIRRRVWTGEVRTAGPSTLRLWWWCNSEIYLNPECSVALPTPNTSCECPCLWPRGFEHCTNTTLWTTLSIKLKMPWYNGALDQQHRMYLILSLLYLKHQFFLSCVCKKGEELNWNVDHRCCQIISF